MAAILGVSRQRVAQLATAALDFPPAEVELAAGRIWAREAIERWAADHSDRGARAPALTIPAAGEWPPAVRAVRIWRRGWPASSTTTGLGRTTYS